MLWVYCVCFENRYRNYNSSVLILKITVILGFAFRFYYDRFICKTIIFCLEYTQLSFIDQTTKTLLLQLLNK